jgi:hypothetical protein
VPSAGVIRLPSVAPCCPTDVINYSTFRLQ